MAAFAAQLSGTANWLEVLAADFSAARHRFDGLEVQGTWSGRGRNGFHRVRTTASAAASKNSAMASHAASRLRMISAEVTTLAQRAATLESTAASSMNDPALLHLSTAQLRVLSTNVSVLEARASAALSDIRWQATRIATEGHTNASILASFASASPHNRHARAHLLNLARTGANQVALGDPVGLALTVAAMTPRQREEILEHLGTTNAAEEARGTLALFDSIAAQHPDVDLRLVASTLANHRPAAQAFVAAAAYAGFTEGPSNEQPFAAMVGHAPNQAWCTTFVNAVSKMTSTPVPLRVNDAYTETQRNAWIKNDAWFEADPQAPAKAGQPGDYIYFWGPSRGAGRTVTHVGMVIAPLGAGRVLTIEGNAAPGAASDAGSAQGVHFHVRENTPDMKIVGYGRPDWDSDVAADWAVPTN